MRSERRQHAAYKAEIESEVRSIVGLLAPTTDLGVRERMASLRWYLATPAILATIIATFTGTWPLLQTNIMAFFAPIVIAAFCHCAGRDRNDESEWGFAIGFLSKVTIILVVCMGATLIRESDQCSVLSGDRLNDYNDCMTKLQGANGFSVDAKRRACLFRAGVDTDGTASGVCSSILDGSVGEFALVMQWLMCAYMLIISLYCIFLAARLQTIIVKQRSS